MNEANARHSDADMASILIMDSNSQGVFYADEHQEQLTLLRARRDKGKELVYANNSFADQDRDPADCTTPDPNHSINDHQFEEFSQVLVSSTLGQPVIQSLSDNQEYSNGLPQRQ